MSILRVYQDQCANKTIEDLSNGYKSGLIACATGLGKTEIGCHVIERWPEQGKRFLWLAHREELINQAAQRIKNVTGFDPSIEMADINENSEGIVTNKKYVVGMVQSMMNAKRLSRFNPLDFDLLICDECHHFCPKNKSYWNIWQHFKGGNPNLKLIGMTATPDRADEEALGQVFETVLFEMGILEGINEGWLVPILQQFVRVQGLDFSECRLVAGELNQEQLELIINQETMIHKMVAPMIDVMAGRKVLIFCVTIDHAMKTAEIINRYVPDSAVAICGRNASDKDFRRDELKKFHNGDRRFLVSCAVFCLDQQTEILTSDGWVGIDGMTYEHKVANWNDGQIFFKEPKFIVKRDRLPDEGMVFTETSKTSIRVTDKHRMLCRAYKGGTFKIKHASKLVGRRFQVPISGHAAPFNVQPEQPPPASHKQHLTAMRANSYVLRKKGFDSHAATMEATKRLTRKYQRRRLCPAELTLAQCRFIGFFLAEGCASKLQGGGIEYVVAQSQQYAKIIEWFDEVIRDIGVDCRRKERPRHGGIVLWSFSRGTGFGPQERMGLFGIEPYLEKSGSNLLWGLNDEQFSCLLTGLWYGDGNHGQAEVVPPTLRISNTSKSLLDLLQAIGTCRGTRITINPDKRHAKPHHKTVYSMVCRLADAITIGTQKAFIAESDWKAERVWCVTSETGNIVTRRNGIVVITGNTEGFDAPTCDGIVWMRPTLSRAFYSQGVGRSTRVLTEVVESYRNGELLWRLQEAEERRQAIEKSLKPNALVLDFVGNSGRHKLINTGDILGDAVPEEFLVKATVKAQAEALPVDLVQLAKRIEEEEREAKRKKREEEIAKRKEWEQKRREMEKLAADRKKVVRAEAEFTLQDVDPFDAFDTTPQREPGWHRGRRPSPAMLKKLEAAGIVDAERYTFWQAHQLIDEIIRRDNEKLCGYSQAKLLAALGKPTDIPIEEAEKILGQAFESGELHFDQMQKQMRWQELCDVAKKNAWKWGWCVRHFTQEFLEQPWEAKVKPLARRGGWKEVVNFVEDPMLPF